MVVTSGGLVVTNNHVIIGATKITATDIGNGTTYTARVVGYDHGHDIAVLQLEGASGLKTVNLVTRAHWRSARASPRSATPAEPVERPARPADR